MMFIIHRKHTFVSHEKSASTRLAILFVALFGLSLFASTASAQFGTIDLNVSRTYQLGTIDGMVPNQGQKVVVARPGPGTWYDYWFSIPGQRRIVVLTPGNHIGAALFDRNQRFLQVTQYGRAERTVAAGTYFVRVFGNSSTASGARITIRADVQNTNDTAGNALNRARNLGSPGNPPVRVNEFVGQQDFWDYYRFTVNTTSEINVRVTPQYDGVNLVLFSGSGQRLTSTDFSTIKYRNAAPGTYYLLAQIKNQTTSGNNTRYTLDVGTLAQTPPAPPSTLCRSDASDVRQNACPRGPYPGTEVRESIGGLDTADWFYPQAHAASPARQRPRLTVSTSVPLNLQLFDPRSNQPLTTGVGSLGASALQRGTGYYLRITPVGPGVTPYTADFTGLCS